MEFKKDSGKLVKWLTPQLKTYMARKNMSKSYDKNLLSLYNEVHMGVTYVDKLKGNYLLVHGTADDNVHFQNSTEMVNALVNSNKQFDFFAYPDKNHGIYGGYTRLHLYTKMTNFLNENLNYKVDE